MSKQDLNAIIDEAFAAAKVASDAAFTRIGGDKYPCGFAWVNISPGTSAIARELKKRGDARKSYSGGVDVWNPGKSFVQNVDIKYAGARAFADVLQKYGVKAYAMDRLD